MHRRALENRHDDLGGTVTGHHSGDHPTRDHEIPVAVKDSAIEQEGGEFNGGCSCGVENFDQDEALSMAHD